MEDILEKRQAVLSGRHEKFKPHLKKLAETKGETAMGKLKLPKYLLTLAYEDKRDFNFEGSVADYMRWLSTIFIVTEWENEIWERLELKGMVVDDVPVRIEIEDVIDSLVKKCLRNRYDCINMANLIAKDYDHLFSLISYDYYTKYVNFDIELANYMIVRTIFGIAYGLKKGMRPEIIKDASYNKEYWEKLTS